MNVGGPAVLIDGLIRGLPSKEFEHHLITGQCEDNEIDYLEAHPELRNLVEIHSFESMKRSLLPIKDISVLLQTIRTLRNLKPNIVHTHTSKAGVIGRLAARIASPKSQIIHTFHGHLLYGYFSPFKVSVVVVIEKAMARFSNVLVAVTSQIKKDLISKGVGKANCWEVIHPGVNPVEKQRSTVANKKHLVWIGRFTAIKNPYLALKIMRELKKKDSTINLTMVGDGELFGEISQKAKEENLNIVFTGWQTDIYPYLHTADALLISSKNEGLPLVMLEAASLRIPTVSTNVGGISEFIEDRKSGIFISENTTSASADIFNLFDKPDQVESLGQKAYAKFNEGFSMKSFVDSHINLYKKISR